MIRNAGDVKVSSTGDAELQRDHRDQRRPGPAFEDSPSGFELADMRDIYGRDGSSQENRDCNAASTGNHVFSASSSVSAHSA